MILLTKSIKSIHVGRLTRSDRVDAMKSKSGQSHVSQLYFTRHRNLAAETIWLIVGLIIVHVVQGSSVINKCPDKLIESITLMLWDT
jgi:hypothetical protein